MSHRSEHIEGAFTQGYWAVQVRLRGDETGPRFLCHATNDREARRIAEDLAAGISGARGFAYHRLLAPPPAELPRLGEHVEIVTPDAWRRVTDQIAGDDRLNPRAD
jgi:hypothetical protein